MNLEWKRYYISLGAWLMTVLHNIQHKTLYFVKFWEIIFNIQHSHESSNPINRLCTRHQ